MGVKERGNFSRVRRDAQRAMERSIRDLTREAYREIRRETPRRTGVLRGRWRMGVRGLSGVIGNPEKYAPVVALGRRNRSMSGRERRNVAFHLRGLQNAMKRAKGIFARAFRGAF